MEMPIWLLVNVYTLVLLILLYIFSGSTYLKEKQNRAYRYLLILVMLLEIMETVASAIESMDNYVPYLRILNVVRYFSYLLDPFGGYLTCVYIENWMMEGKRKMQWLKPFLLFFALLNAALVSLSLVFNLGWFYQYAPDGTYIRGILYYPRAIYMLSYCILVFVQLIRNRKLIYDLYFWPLITFPILVFVTGLMQAILGEVAYEYVGTTLSCLILLVFVQNRDITTDYLTGISNRRRLYAAVEAAIEDCEEHPFAAIMVDIDHFKQINDTYGHQTGDEALVNTARILRGAFPGNDIVGRLGGDEFCIVTRVQDQISLDHKMELIRERFDSFNHIHQEDYQLQVSMGSLLYRKEYEQSTDDFFHELDMLMYREKEQHHAITNKEQEVLSKDGSK